MSKPRRFLPLTALIAGFAFATSGLSAQTLARPGWVGSGMTAQTWFRHAVIYQIDTRSFQDSNRDGIGDLKGITERLDYIRSLGADAILLAPLTPSGGPANAIDPVLGTLDDLDDLTLQASRVKIRILLELPDPDPALARFWLSRGLAGFQIPDLNSSKQSNSAAIQAIRKLLPGYVGQRVLITDAEPAAAAANPAVAGKPAGNELVLDTALLKLPAPTNSSSDSTPHPQAAPAANSTIAGQLRAALEAAHALARPESLLLAADAPGVPRSLDRFAANGSAPGHASDMGRIVTTVLMLSHSGVLLSAGEELALQSSSGTDVTIPWGAPPATSPPPAEDQPASASAAAPSRPGARDVYVPYVAPKTAAKPPTEAPPDPASAAGQESNPKSPLNFYRQLNQLRHGGTALRDGDVAYLDFDALNALVWIRRPASPTYANPPIVILCNLSGIPVTIELKPELLRLHLRGSFLKTILRSDSGMGAMDISPVHLPPYTVYVGELKF